jgi:hypothetical protein
VYSQAEAHLANLDICGGRNLRRAYILLLIAGERAGLHTTAREGIPELGLREPAGEQPFAVAVAIDSLTFSLRPPALLAAPERRAEAAIRFAGRLIGDRDGGEIRIRIQNERDAEDIIAWLFHKGDFSL